MCNKWCLDFVRDSLQWWPVDASVLEIGSRNVNGSPRDVCAGRFSKYLGVDLEMGPGVDLIMNGEELDLPERYDVVISTEMLEHAHDWRRALLCAMNYVDIGGILVLTTRCPGFEYHPYPEDNWRFTGDDFQVIFNSDFGDEPFELLKLEFDPDKRRGQPSGVGVIVLRKGEYLALLRERVLRRKIRNVHTEGIG